MSVAPVSNHVSVLDGTGLLELFSRVAGRKLVGAVDGGSGCVELVFEDRGNLGGNLGGNLVSIFTGEWHRGSVALGYVSQELIDSGYCDG